MTKFTRALALEPMAVPPIWMMRQAGRYHSAYQRRRAQHDFETLCRVPKLAADVTMDPIVDFDFDAAIVFSDLLFPLEALGMQLSYADGPPKLDGPITADRVAAWRSDADADARVRFIPDAVSEVRARLPRGKSLIGFVGGPWTLFVYAVEGAHSGVMARAKSDPALYRACADRLVPVLRNLISAQLDAGADLVMVFDTAAGELSSSMFASWTAADLGALASAAPGRVGYYSKMTHTGHLAALADQPWAVRGVDHRWQLASVLKDTQRSSAVQGNFDPALLLSLRGSALDSAIDDFLAPIAALSQADRRGWICGLGHGVLQGTPEDNVRQFIARVREVCR